MGSVMCQDVDWIIIITIMKMNTIHKYTVLFRFQIRSYISPIIDFKDSEISFEPPSLHLSSVQKAFWLTGLTHKTYFLVNFQQDAWKFVFWT